MQCKFYRFDTERCTNVKSRVMFLADVVRPSDCCDLYDRVGDMDEPTPERRAQWRGER